MQGLLRYAAGAALLQVLLLAGCGKPAPTPAPVPTSTPSKTANDAVAPRPAGPERLVLAFGDSLYAGYGLDRGQSLPDAIQTRVRQRGWRSGLRRLSDQVP